MCIYRAGPRPHTDRQRSRRSTRRVHVHANTRDVRSESTAREASWRHGGQLDMGRDDTETSATRGRKGGLRRWRWAATTLAIGQQAPARMRPARPPPGRTPSPLNSSTTRSPMAVSSAYRRATHMRNTTPLPFALSTSMFLSTARYGAWVPTKPRPGALA